MNRRSRRFLVWLAISIALHGLLAVLIPAVKPHETLTTVSNGPMTVELVPEKPAATTAEQVAPQPRKAEAPPPIPRPVVPPRIVAREAPKATVPLPLPAPPPQPLPPPAKEPPVDMMASIAARRAAREAEEAAMARGPRRPDAADLAEANINRNLRFVPGGGVGGVFQILSKGQLSAEFAFNGWEPSRDRSWREVIEVHVKPGEDIERGIVKRMMELIRGHYHEDFRWESRRLGREVVLSARPEDTEGTEDFLMREFFETPMARR
ncbi:MAG TPA: hypothetical protein VHP55_10225 [Usitatibacter sp.]|nr:hypothetical protein [Usitatibacter sp.]